MTYLVIGAEGQIARAIVQQGARLGADVQALGRPQLDLRQADTVRAALDHAAPRLVINAAAYTAVDLAEDEAEAAFAINHLGVDILAQLCATQNIPLIHFSTDYVFNGAKTTPYNEEDECAPLGIYGASKLKGEEALRARHSKHIILRTAWVHSETGQNFVKTMLRLGEERDELSVVADQIGTPSYGGHIAEAVLALAAQICDEGKSAQDLDEVWGTYHLAGSGEASWHGLANEVFKEAAKYGRAQPIVHPITTEQYPTKAARPQNSRLDCSKLENQFGITMPKWQEGVGACVKRLLGA